MCLRGFEGVGLTGRSSFRVLDEVSCFVVLRTIVMVTCKACRCIGPRPQFSNGKSALDDSDDLSRR